MGLWLCVCVCPTRGECARLPVLCHILHCTMYIVYQPMHNKLQPGVNVHDCLYNKSNCYSNHAQTQMCNAHIMHKVGNPIVCCFLRPCKHQPGYLKSRICLIHVNMNENTNTNVDTNTNTWGGVVWWHCAGATVSPHCLPWAPPPAPRFICFLHHVHHDQVFDGGLGFWKASHLTAWPRLGSSPQVHFMQTEEKCK